MTLLAQMAMQGAVGFAIGAGTNELAIRWVFNALFTKKKKLIAENAKRLIRTELMTSEKIAAKFSAPNVRDAVERGIRQRLDECGDKLLAVFARLGERLDRHVPDIVREEVRALADVAELLDSDIRATVARVGAGYVTDYLAANLPGMLEETDIWNVVYETIMDYDERKMEVLTREVANRELRGVTLWGGFIGATVGLGMSVLMWLIG